MADQQKTRDQLIDELAMIRRRASQLEQSATSSSSCSQLLEETNAKYRAIVNAFDGLIYICSQDYLVEFVNKRFVDRVGRDPVGEKCYKALHDRDRICPWCPNEEVFQGEKVTWEILSPQDNRWYYVVNTPVVHSDGSISKMAMIQDVTSRREADEALRRHEELLSNILAASPVGISYFEEGTLKWTNQAMLDIFGGKDHSVYLGKAPHEFYETREEYDRVRAVFFKSLAAGEVSRADAKLKRLDGSVFDGEIVLSAIDPSNARKGTIASISDVSRQRRSAEELRVAHTELEQRVRERTADLQQTNQRLLAEIADRERAEQELRNSEERFRAVFEGAGDCIFIKDENLRYTDVNPAMNRLLGLESSQIIGKRAHDLFGPEAGEQVREFDLRVLEGQSIENEHTRPVNSEPVTFHDTRVPLRDAEGRIVGICGISRNITERRKAYPAGRSILITEYPSKAARAAMADAGIAAESDSMVLLLGESGSGKDYFARWIHDHSKRASGPFFALNCAAIPAELAESELFGHERGAFTSAKGRKRGLLELAEGGTLLLNEIGELSLPLQSKLLTFLDTRSFLRVGGEKSVYVNARLIAATHRQLDIEVAEGRFLQALFYRLNVLSIRVPPLRERREDIPFLVEEIMTELTANLPAAGKPMIDEESKSLLCAYAWPGNIRELRNVIERSLMLSDGKVLRITLLPSAGTVEEWSQQIRFPKESSLRDVTDHVTHSLCVEALRRSGGNKKEAARTLGISRDSLYRYIDRFAIVSDIPARS